MSNMVNPEQYWYTQVQKLLLPTPTDHFPPSTPRLFRKK